MTIFRHIKGTCVAFALRSFPKLLVEQTTTTRLFSASNFKAPTPPSSNGVAVYEDIDLSQFGDNALLRNNDPDAVFFISGGSRGKKYNFSTNF